MWPAIFKDFKDLRDFKDFKDVKDVKDVKFFKGVGQGAIKEIGALLRSTPIRAEISSLRKIFILQSQQLLNQRERQSQQLQCQQQLQLSQLLLQSQSQLLCFP